MSNGTNVRIGASTSDFQKQMKNMVQNLKNVSSEFSVSATQAKLFGKESDVLKVKQKELAEKIKIQTDMVKLQTENIEKLTKELKEQKDEQEKLKDKISDTEKAYKESCEATGESSEESRKLKEELKDLNSEYNSNEKAIDKQSSKVDNANIKLNNTKKELMENGKALRDVNEQLSSNKIDKFTEKLDKMGNKTTEIGKKMSGLSAGLVGAAAKSVQAYDEVDEGMDNVVKATGATGKAAEELESVYKDVASSFEGDFATMGSALGEVNTRFGYTGNNAKECTEKFLRFSKINGTDVVTSVQSVSRAMNSAKIGNDEYNVVLDQLTSIAQATGTDINKLSDNLSKYGASTRAMGFGTKETIALMGTFEKSGMNTESIMAGMTKATVKWAKEGKNSKNEFNNVIKSIQNAKTPIEASKIAIENFGSKSGTELAEAIKTGKFAYGDFIKVLDDSNGIVDSTFENTRDGMDDLQVATNNFKMAGAELGGTIMTMVTPVIQSVASTVKNCVKWFSGLSDSTKQNIVKFAGLVASIGPVLVIVGKLSTGISSTVKGFKSVIEFGGKAIPKIKEFGTGALNCAKHVGNFALSAGKAALSFGKMAIQAGIATVKFIAHKAATIACTVAQKAMSLAQAALNLVMSLNPITLIIMAIVALVATIVVLWNKCEWFRNLCMGLFNALKTTFNATIEFFKAIGRAFVAGWNGAVNGIKSVFNTVCNFFKKIWDGVCNFFGKAWDGACNGVKNVFTGVKNTVVGIAQGMVNMVIKAINFCIRALNKLSFDVPDWVPAIGGSKFGFNIKEIAEVNWYDKGGIFTSPQIIGVGEKRPEFVGALDDLRYLLRDELKKNNITNTNNNVGGSIILQIEKFYNNTDDDIDDLVKKLDFYRRRHKK